MDKKGINRRIFVGASVAGAGLVTLGGVMSLSTGGRRAGDKLGERFEYDLGELVKTDESLIGYRVEKTVASGFECVRDMAVGEAGQIAVTGEKAVLVLEGDGKDVGRIELDGQPTGVGFGDDGRLYVAVGDHVKVFDGEYELLASWPRISGRAYVTNVKVSGESVFLADAGNRAVWRCDLAGEVVAPIAQKDEKRGIAGLILPSPYFAIAVDGKQEILWVANTGRHCVEGYTFDGELVRRWGEPRMAIEGFCGCCNPCHFTLLRDGRFVTCEKGLPRVKVYDAGGKFTTVVAGPECFVRDGSEVTLNMSACEGRGPIAAAGSDGSILVYHPQAGEIRSYQPV